MLELEYYVFGLSRSATQQTGRGKMRFVPEGESKENGTLCDRLVGQWWVNNCDRDGNIHAECAIDFRQDTRGKVAYLYHPDIEEAEVPEAVDQCALPEGGDNHDHCQVGTDDPFPQGRDTHWRLCYAREKAASGMDMFWRLRDERSDQLWFVNGYEGPMSVNWYDQGTHIFCDGPAWVDENMVAHFGNND